ncbi:MAG: DUF4270 family protein [Vicingaceae bacterium]
MNINITLLLQKTFFFSVLFLMTLLFSCKKDGALSPDFDNGDLSISFIDTLDIETTVLQEDSLRTDLSTSNLLGAFNDPIFGPVSSSIYTNIDAIGFPLSFGSSVSIDSVVLSLDYITSYGNIATTMTVNVYELVNPLSASVDYYSSTYTSTKTTLLGSTTYKAADVDSVLTLVDSVMHPPQLRVTLNDPSLIAALKNGSPFNSTSDLNNALAGIYIVTTDSANSSSPLAVNTGAISYFNLNSSVSKVTVYYNNSDADSLQEDLIINSDTKKYSQFSYNFTGTDIEKHLTNNTNKDSTRLYVATLGRAKSKIMLPNIKDLIKDGPVVINKAELIFSLEDGTDDALNKAMVNLALTGINESNQATFLPDNFEGTDHFGGIYDDELKTYRFNISRHVHDLLYNTTTDYGMYLKATNSSVTANRVVIGSEKSTSYKLRLEITYSKI